MRLNNRLSSLFLHEAVQSAQKLGIRKASAPLEQGDITSKNTIKLALNLSRILIKTKGLGFAAPQIGEFRQMMVLQRPLFHSKCILTPRQLAEPTNSAVGSIAFESPPVESVPIDTYASSMRNLMRRLSRSIEPPMVVCNPTILRTAKARTIEYEGCLSVPDWLAPVERPSDVEVRYLELVLPEGLVQNGSFTKDNFTKGYLTRTEESQTSLVDVSGLQKRFTNDEELIEAFAGEVQIVERHMNLYELAARIFQHEYDHLCGKLFIDSVDIAELGGFEYSPLQEDPKVYAKRVAYMRRCQASGAPVMPPKRLELNFPVSTTEPIIPVTESEGIEPICNA